MALPMTTPLPNLPSRGGAAAGRLLLLISFPLYVLDQVTKWLVDTRIPPMVRVSIIPGWFSLENVTNTGAAWGMFQHGNRGFLFLSIAALIVLAVLYRQGAFAQPLAHAGFFLLIPGILGNLTDRLARGHVIDFLRFDLHVPLADPWPSFNVADSCICLAVTGFILGSLQDLRRAEGNP
jgi:signal peptidase II